jgi:hypothetical protein
MLIWLSKEEAHLHCTCNHTHSPHPHDMTCLQCFRLRSSSFQKAQTWNSYIHTQKKWVYTKFMHTCIASHACVEDLQSQVSW